MSITLFIKRTSCNTTEWDWGQHIHTWSSLPCSSIFVSFYITPRFGPSFNFSDDPYFIFSRHRWLQMSSLLEGFVPPSLPPHKAFTPSQLLSSSKYWFKWFTSGKSSCTLAPSTLAQVTSVINFSAVYTPPS